MANIAGDTGNGYGSLPRPPRIPGYGLDGIVKSFAQLVKLVNDTGPGLARRIAVTLDYHRKIGS